MKGGTSRSTKAFVVDCSNFSYDLDDEIKDDFATLFQVLKDLRSAFPGAKLYPIMDGSTVHKAAAGTPNKSGAINDTLRRLRKSLAEHEVAILPVGVREINDRLMLDKAAELRAAMVSNDTYRQHVARYDWLNEPGRLYSAWFSPAEGSWSFAEAVAGDHALRDRIRKGEIPDLEDPPGGHGLAAVGDGQPGVGTVREVPPPPTAVNRAAFAALGESMPALVQHAIATFKGNATTRPEQVLDAVFASSLADDALLNLGLSSIYLGGLLAKTDVPFSRPIGKWVAKHVQEHHAERLEVVKSGSALVIRYLPSVRAERYLTRRIPTKLGSKATGAKSVVALLEWIVQDIELWCRMTSSGGVALRELNKIVQGMSESYRYITGQVSNAELIALMEHVQITVVAGVMTMAAATPTESDAATTLSAAPAEPEESAAAAADETPIRTADFTGRDAFNHPDLPVADEDAVLTFMLVEELLGRYADTADLPLATLLRAVRSSPAGQYLLMRSGVHTQTIGQIYGVLKIRPPEKPLWRSLQQVLRDRPDIDIELIRTGFGTDGNRLNHYHLRFSPEARLSIWLQRREIEYLSNHPGDEYPRTEAFREFGRWLSIDHEYASKLLFQEDVPLASLRATVERIKRRSAITDVLVSGPARLYQHGLNSADLRLAKGEIVRLRSNPEQWVGPQAQFHDFDPQVFEDARAELSRRRGLGSEHAAADEPVGVAPAVSESGGPGVLAQKVPEGIRPAPAPGKVVMMSDEDTAMTAIIAWENRALLDGYQRSVSEIVRTLLEQPLGVALSMRRGLPVGVIGRFVAGSRIGLWRDVLVALDRERFEMVDTAPTGGTYVVKALPPRRLDHFLDRFSASDTLSQALQWAVFDYETRYRLLTGGLSYHDELRPIFLQSTDPDRRSILAAATHSEVALHASRIGLDLDRDGRLFMTAGTTVPQLALSSLSEATVRGEIDRMSAPKDAPVDSPRRDPEPPTPRTVVLAPHVERHIEHVVMSYLYLDRMKEAFATTPFSLEALGARTIRDPNFLMTACRYGFDVSFFGRVIAANKLKLKPPLWKHIWKEFLSKHSDAVEAVQVPGIGMLVFLRPSVRLDMHLMRRQEADRRAFDLEQDVVEVFKWLATDIEFQSLLRLEGLSLARVRSIMSAAGGAENQELFGSVMSLELAEAAAQVGLDTSIGGVVRVPPRMNWQPPDDLLYRTYMSDDEYRSAAHRLIVNGHTRLGAVMNLPPPGA